MLNIPNSQPRVAVLIDADNAQLNKLSQILQIADVYGTRTISHIYGDWKQLPLKPNLKLIDKLPIKRIQVNRIGKDATDKKLLIDTGKILGANDADVFIIVSGDADFRLLCETIRNDGKTVIGIGNQKQTSEALIQSCDKFHFIEDLGKELTGLKKKPNGFEKLLKRVFSEINPETNRVHCGVVHQMLCELEPGYRKKFNNKKLGTLVKACKYFELHGNYVHRL